MTILMTGFPGFLGSNLLPRLLSRTPTDAVCLVQPKFAVVAARRAEQLVAGDSSLEGRIRLIHGDITRPGLGLAAGDRPVLTGVKQIWHLAAVYDLAVARDLATRVNVEGTRYVLDIALTPPSSAWCWCPPPWSCSATATGGSPAGSTASFPASTSKPTTTTSMPSSIRLTTTLPCRPRSWGAQVARSEVAGCDTTASA